MRPMYLAVTAAALALSASALTAAPFSPDTHFAASSNVTKVHSSCHNDVREHGGFDHYHQWQGQTCATFSVQVNNHCHGNSQYHSHSGFGSLWHSHSGGNCGVVQNFQNYPQNNNCVTLGAPGAFSFSVCP